MSRKLSHYFRFFTNPYVRFYCFQELGLYNKMSDEEFLKKKYKSIMGAELNLENPRGFNEKIQWLKLNDRNPQYTIMADKYAAKQYLSRLIDDKYIIPTLGVWNGFEEIDFDALPESFVLKTTHDCGGVYVCDNKAVFNKQAAKKKMEWHLKRDYYISCREWPYKNIKPRIIAEKYIGESGMDLMDYKLLCFNGKVKCSFVCAERFSSAGLQLAFFDREWNKMPFTRHYPMLKRDIPKPIHYNEMIEISEIVSKDMRLLRVDFYEINGRLYIGELTLYPGSGFEEFEPKEWDYKIGDMIKL